MSFSASAQTALRDPLADAIRNCPRATGAEIVVCGARENAEAERYRLPLRDTGFAVDGPEESVSRERHRLYDVGGTGTGSCSNVGASGATGCMIRGWRAQEQQRGGR